MYSGSSGWGYLSTTANMAGVTAGRRSKRNSKKDGFSLCFSPKYFTRRKYFRRCTKCIQDREAREKEKPRNWDRKPGHTFRLCEKCRSRLSAICWSRFLNQAPQRILRRSTLSRKMLMQMSLSNVYSAVCPTLFRKESNKKDLWDQWACRYPANQTIPLPWVKVFVAVKTEYPVLLEILFTTTEGQLTKGKLNVIIRKVNNLKN